jgi:small nuclear ribonucleoprotein (snRNP)-like protein
MLVELKNGETLNGHLVNCDTWMNLTLKEVVQTSPEGDRFVKLAEVYVRGNNVSSTHFHPHAPSVSWVCLLSALRKSQRGLYDISGDDVSEDTKVWVKKGDG